MNWCYNKKIRGFSLLELILAIAVFSLGSVALATLLIDANISTRLGSERIQALFYAKEGIEAARSIRDNDWDSLAEGDNGLLNDGSGWSFSGSSDLIDSSSEVDDDKYTRVVSVTSSATSTKDVSVNITWDITSARTASVTLDTILTNWHQ